MVDDYLPHSTKIGAKMMHELGVALVNKGHEVAVATPDFRIDSKYELEQIDGVDVYRFFSRNVKDDSKVKRAINETMLSRSAWKNLKPVFKELSFELIVYYSPSIFFGPLVSKLKKRWNARSYMILRDLFPQWVIDHGLIKENSPIASYFRTFEKLNYKAADTIGLQSRKNLEWFQRKYPQYNAEIVYNWSDEAPIEKPSGSFRKKFGLENKVIFFYGGNMGEAQDMMNLVRLAQNLREEKQAHFVFAGSGNEFHLVQEAIEREGMKNLTLLEPVSQKEYREMLAEFDVGLFSLHRNHTTYNFPGKLLGYMAQGLPILGSVNPGNDVIEVIEEAGAGYVGVNGDDYQFLDNARKLLESKEFREAMGKKALGLLRGTFSVDSAVERVIGSLAKDTLMVTKDG